MALTLAQLQVINNVDPSGQLAAALTSGGAATALTPNTIKASTSIENDGLRIEPATPVAVANAATINLSTVVTRNTLRPTGDATIAGAVINMPTTPVDGQVCTIATTAAITAVTGTLSTAPVPATTTLAAGQSKSYVWNAAASLWLPA